MGLSSTFSIPAMWQAEEVPLEDFADVTRPISQNSSFARDTGGWLMNKEGGAQIPILDYSDTPLDSSPGFPPNMVDDLSLPSAVNTSASMTTLSQNLKPSAISTISIPETTANEL